MYFYFALVVSPTLRAYIRPYSGLITILQIIQMILGLCITVYANLYCGIDSLTIVMSCAMYGSYLYLFVKFYFTRESKTTEKNDNNSSISKKHE